MWPTLKLMLYQLVGHSTELQSVAHYKKDIKTLDFRIVYITVFSISYCYATKSYFNRN